ncbi:DUF7490 domain-containing protein [Halobacterium sp. KA-6]|uniref:DUF7490 domain-containing protein n=1 Tax=Halobacterium sp. KA-6 TaxID=2896368 RepID=UPI001E31DB1B|nr:hypothetical protein [Halobacterium sp. KA-6]MCD2203440.1 hypothetical protein [Halobacterium sp. KA-6]
MRRERVLAVGIAVLLVASAVTMVAVPGVFADREPDDVRPGRANIQEVTLATNDVSGGTVTLGVTSYLRHYGGTSENVSILVRAVDLDSGLVETTRRVDVDTITGDREVPVEANISVAREGGYRIETVLYSDDQRVGTVSKTVRGVGTVQAGGRAAFHDFAAGLPSIQYSVTDAGPNRTALDVSTYLTNSGAAPSGPVTVELIVRQADSNIVAARTTISVSEVAPGETVAPSTTVTVPAGYNYYLDAVLRKNGVIVDAARSAANLDPQERIEANTTVRDVGLQVEDFEQTDGQDQPQPTPDSEGSTGGGVPGFGPALAVVALAIGAAITWRTRS